MIYAQVYDQTLENDYRQAMRQIERQQMPLSETPIPLETWPSGATYEFSEAQMSLPTTLDNSL